MFAEICMSVNGMKTHEKNVRMYRPCESVSGNICIPYVDDNLVITYNLLNLPKEIKKSGTVVSKYTYLSDGSKVSSCDAGGNGYMYFGTARFTLDNNVPTFESISFSGGRIVRTTNGYEPQYYLTDHLGSTRAIVNKDGQTVEATFDYTPFGVQIVDSQMPTNSTEYRFSGKELQNISDYEIYDFGARRYFPKYAIWSSVDPLAGSFANVSPFAYCSNNPVLFVDPNGMAWYSYRDKDEDGNDVKKYYYSETKLTEQQRKAGRYTLIGLTGTTDDGRSYLSLYGEKYNKYNKDGSVNLYTEMISNLDRAIVNYYKAGYENTHQEDPNFPEYYSSASDMRISLNVTPQMVRSNKHITSLKYETGRLLYFASNDRDGYSFDWGNGAVRPISGYMTKYGEGASAKVAKGQQACAYWIFPTTKYWAEMKNRTEKIFRGFYIE